MVDNNTQLWQKVNIIAFFRLEACDFVASVDESGGWLACPIMITSCNNQLNATRVLRLIGVNGVEAK